MCAHIWLTVSVLYSSIKSESKSRKRKRDGKEMLEVNEVVSTEGVAEAIEAGEGEVEAGEVARETPFEIKVCPLKAIYWFKLIVLSSCMQFFAFCILPRSFPTPDENHDQPAVRKTCISCSSRSIA